MNSANDTIQIPKRYLNVIELAEYLGKSKWWIYGKVKLRQIPFISMGRQPRFDMKIIDAWMAKKSVRAA